MISPESEKKQLQLAMAIKSCRENMPALFESIALQAQLTKAKYDSLIKVGFTPEQALELSKGSPV
jgi:hypothetical protein